MENRLLKIAPVLLLMVFTLTSCEAVASIFKTGFNFGIIAVILVIIGAVFLFSKMRK